MHSYELAPTGAIEKQISSINTLDYYNSGDCYGSVQGTQFGSLNHQGKNVYVVFNGAIRTGGDGVNGLFQAPAIIANDTFAYAASDFTCCEAEVVEDIAFGSPMDVLKIVSRA